MAVINLSAAPVVTLSNGLRIANFSSLHDFTFEDGTVLPACDVERCEALKMVVHENVMNTHTVRGTTFQDIELVKLLGEAVEAELDRMQADESIDLFIVPLMLMELIRGENDYFETKARVIRMVDRIKKIAKIDTFCV